MKLMNILFVLSLIVMASACTKEETAPPPAEEVPAADSMPTPDSDASGDEIELPEEEMDEGH